MTFGEIFKKWGLTGIKINAKFAEMEFKKVEDDQIAAWEMYIELITRVTTQPLEIQSGDEEAALTSVYSIFDITRNILKSRGRQAATFSKTAIVILNQIIRPFTAKWHKKKLQGAFLELDERIQFCEELNALQHTLRDYTKLLADLASVEDLTELDSFE